MTDLTATGIANDQGTIVLFSTAEGPLVAVDHRMAQALADAIEADGPQPIQAESWQILG